MCAAAQRNPEYSRVKERKFRRIKINEKLRQDAVFKTFPVLDSAPLYK
jgi:hypothetical protein